MTTIAFINPNSTKAMTDSCAASFKANLPDGFDVLALTNSGAPAAIQGPEDGEAAIPGVLEIISRTEADAYVIGCFDDTGLAAARQLTGKPVIGIGQAAFHLAALRTGRFFVLTTLSVSVPVIAENIANQGFEPICDGVAASGVPVLDLEHHPERSQQKIAAHSEKILAEFPDTAIVLGCAGMTNIWGVLQQRFQTPLVDPVAAAAKLVAAVTPMR
jgi:allantoin racemase